MDLPSFLWLWRIAAWSMGLSLTAYTALALTGSGLWYARTAKLARPGWLRPLHYGLGIVLVSLVLLLLSIGLIGTVGEYGRLGHSWHLPAGLTVVGLVCTSAWSATRIHPQRPWARSLHVSLNAILLLSFIAVTYSGWQVVQKYLP
ncbi:MAG: DUF4079 domain-containing protein [Leptolyngbya sp. SIO4C1]|nr:DUF4079 domain-containing protein [Leptolyngbya sp. SIO4C1]